MPRHVLLAGAGALALSVAAASAQGTMEAADIDGDGRISAAEWSVLEAESDRWRSYDADASGGVSRDEFRAGEFARHDRNADGVLDAGEYQARRFGIDPLAGAGVGPDVAAETAPTNSTLADAAAADAAAFDGQAATAGLSDFDADADASLSPEEFGASLEGETGPGSFAVYDADASGEIDRDEFAAGEFRRFDFDGDAMIDGEEFQLFLDDHPD